MAPGKGEYPEWDAGQDECYGGSCRMASAASSPVSSGAAPGLLSR